MTEIRKKARPAAEDASAGKTAAGAAAKKSAAARRPKQDDYDAFLEAAEKAERTQRSAARTAAKPAAKAAAAKKTASKGGAETGKPAAKKPEAKSVRTQKSAAASGKRPAAKKPAKKADSDAYDDFLKEAERSRPKKKKGRRKADAKALSAALALLIMIGCLLGLAGWQYNQYQTFLIMKAAVDRSTFYEGTFVEGVDVSGMTLDQAIEHWNTGIEPGYSQRSVTLSNGASFTAAELGYSSDYMTVLGNAWNAGRSGSLVERYEALSQRRTQTANYNVTRAPYSADAIRSCVAAIAEQIDRPARNAHIESFDTSEYTFRFADEVVGSKLDTERLAADMASALDNGGGTAELVVSAIQPEVVKADIAGKYGMITSAVTNASSSSKNRLANIKLALEMIDGTCLKPGETFSFNGVVGQRTKDRGFKVATAYSSGTVVEEVGGGICQVSTTLFNAAVKADLEIVERHNHSLTVSYVDRGKDAAVNWGSQDLRFTNTSGDNIYISCYLDGDKRVRFGVFGKLLPDGETITVEAKTTEKIDFETELVPNAALASGKTQVAQKGKQGYEAEAYKVRWDADGDRISRELLCRSRYKSVTEIIEYGP